MSHRETLRSHSDRIEPAGDEADKEVSYIVVMGPTGTGKSTFINTATRSTQMLASGELEGCTQDIQVSGVSTINGHNVRFIDTPGFDDTMRGDADILRTISAYLAALRAGNKSIAGVIYLKDISHIRMTGTSRRNLRLCQSICGDSSLPNLAIVTTMWSRVSEEEGITRQRSLEEGYFKQMVEKGATVFRHDNTSASTDRIVAHLLRRPSTTLQIQTEIIRDKKELLETEAGQELCEQLGVRKGYVAKEVAALRAELSEIPADDNEMRSEIMEELHQAQTELEHLSTEDANLAKPGMHPLVQFLLTSAVSMVVPAAFSIASVGMVPAVVVAGVVVAVFSFFASIFG